jgi:tetratricopeptide (TPR) repeat protein
MNNRLGRDEYNRIGVKDRMNKAAASEMVHMDEIQPVDANGFAKLFGLARTELKAGRIASALAHCDTLIATYPDRPHGFMLKARSLTAEKRFDEALETLRTGLSRHGSELKLLRLARNVALEAGGFALAMEFANRVSELAPTDVRNRGFLVQSYVVSEDWELARSATEELVAEFAHEPVAWKLKAQALLAEGRLEEALGTLEQALQIHPEDMKLLMIARYTASQQGRIADAIEYARRLSAIAPDHHNNRVFLATIEGDFAEILRCSEALINEKPTDARGWMMKADALVALHRPEEALESLREALSAIGPDQRLLAQARNIAYAHGRFRAAVDFAVELLTIIPDDRWEQYLLTRCLTAAGDIDGVGRYLEEAGPRALEQPLRKAARNYGELERLKRTVPPLVRAWREALDNVAEPTSETAEADYEATVIQYWSQGTPPDDVQVAMSEWKQLLERERLGQVKLFDRPAAKAWISENAPEFSQHFAKAFHFAMEADIFRIAYASKLPCIYVDADDWPLENTASILKFCIRKQKSLLFFRAYKPWISNGFFVSTPTCPFFRELVSQCLKINLDEWPNNRETIGKTFGPDRFNEVLVDLIRNSASCAVSAVQGLPGCSTLRLDGDEVCFSHEAAVAALKPPFMLGYKATEAYWKKIEV